MGEPVPVTLADGGYHTAANLAAGEQRGDLFVMMTGDLSLKPSAPTYWSRQTKAVIWRFGCLDNLLTMRKIYK